MESRMNESRRATATNDDTSPPCPQALDPCTLGRPVHMLHAFAGHFREDLCELLRTRLNRRYQADFQVLRITIEATGKTAPAGRWQGYTSPEGRIACALERPLLLSALVYRYGLAASDHASSAAGEAAPETATEERLAAILGQLFAAALVARIDKGLNNLVDTAGDSAPPVGLGPILPPRAACLIRATIREQLHDTEGDLLLALDEQWMSILLGKLASTPRRRGSDSTLAQPLAARLNFKLVARLLQKEMPLGELLNLRVGDVIPVSMRSADVLVDDSRLMTATVAEHKGKLCLTSFEDTK